MEICSWGTGLLIILFVFCCFFWNIIHLFYWLKCFKVKECTSEKCPMKHYCDKWAEVYTEEDKQAIGKLLEECERDKSIIDKKSMKYEDNYWKIIDGILYAMDWLAALSFIGTAVWIVVMGILMKFC